jgi:hypothetical protein
MLIPIRYVNVVSFLILVHFSPFQESSWAVIQVPTQCLLDHSMYCALQELLVVLSSAMKGTNINMCICLFICCCMICLCQFFSCLCSHGAPMYSQSGFHSGPILASILTIYLEQNLFELSRCFKMNLKMNWKCSQSSLVNLPLIHNRALLPVAKPNLCLQLQPSSKH